jgi:hypothetical protein
MLLQKVESQRGQYRGLQMKPLAQLALDQAVALTLVASTDRSADGN